MKKIDLAPRPTFKHTITPSISTTKPKKTPAWTGVDWSHSTARPGCQDFLKHPSRRGDELVEYKAPILNAASGKYL